MGTIKRYARRQELLPCLRPVFHPYQAPVFFGYSMVTTCRFPSKTILIFFSDDKPSCCDSLIILQKQLFIQQNTEILNLKIL
jgi:hypothetical protein